VTSANLPEFKNGYIVLAAKPQLRELWFKDRGRSDKMNRRLVLTERSASAIRGLGVSGGVLIVLVNTESNGVILARGIVERRIRPVIPC
jgi:hypothetical protein